MKKAADKCAKCFESYTHRTAKWIGSGSGFLAAFISLLIWGAIGDAYRFSNRWENTLSIYIGILTFLMIFVMQRAQNKELAALQIKLNEIIVASAQTDKNLINAENLTEKEISQVRESHGEIVKEQNI